ncbi:MAG: hypothetical protein ACWGQW_00575 [bacterium]
MTSIPVVAAKVEVCCVTKETTLRCGRCDSLNVVAIEDTRHEDMLVCPDCAILNLVPTIVWCECEKEENSGG